MILGIGGCSPDPEAVYVDSALITQTSQTFEIRIPGVVVESNSSSASLEIEQGSARQTRINRVRLLELQEAFVQGRQEAFDQVLEDLLAQAIRRVKAENEVYRIQIQGEIEAKWKVTAAELREIFVQAANVEGPLLQELAGRWGWPPKEPSRIRSEDKPFTEFNRKRAEELRESLAENRAEFSRKAEEVLAEFESERQEIWNDYRVDAEFAEANALAEARAQSELIVESNESELENVLPEGELGWDLRSKSGKANFQVGSERSGDIKETKTRQEDIELMMKIFAESKGYRLVSDSRAGRNATQEFLEWRRGFKATP